MSNDALRDLSQNPLVRRLGVPRIPVLRRYEPGAPLLPGPALVGAIGDGRFAEPVRAMLDDVAGAVGKVAAVVLDATAARTLDDLAEVQRFLTPAVRRLAPGGRLLLLGPSAGDTVEAAAVAQALDGLIRSAAKEVRAGATANLLVVSPDAAIDSSVRFFLSARSAYVDGQVVHVGPALPVEAAAGRVAVVTGAARGIGAAIAATLARDGATVVAVDIPAAGEALARVANAAGGTARLSGASPGGGASALQLDITSPGAAERLIAYVRDRHGHVDVLVHNAGITRDKLLANMDADRWDSVIAVNLRAQLAINVAIGEVLSDTGRIVCVASTSGIAGNRGQTNYAASKAGVIGMVRAVAPVLAPRGITINAVAPGFIETEMTARMPLGTREAGRRINSLRQGGLPVDVAETVGWLGEAASGGITGQVVRVCGQSLVGGMNPYVTAVAGLIGPRARDLPETELRRPVRVDRSHLAEYARVCGFTVGDALPPTYPHLLAFPLQLRLMAGRSFPLPLPGLVHIANAITVHRRIDASEELDVRVHAERLVPHPRGTQVDLVGRVCSGGEPVWDGRSTYLARIAAPATSGARAEPIGGRPSATWRVGAGTGRRYAAVSGDVNPIHLHPWTARAFGFPRAIAHGMWTAAHALAALEGRLPDALTYDTEFGRPLLLPSTVELRTRAVDGGWDLDVRSHLTGAIRRSVG